MLGHPRKIIIIRIPVSEEAGVNKMFVCSTSLAMPEGQWRSMLNYFTPCKE
jgi:hypothetical protein